MSETGAGFDRVRLGELFEQALSLDAAARPAFAEGACADDPALGRELRSLLNAYARSRLEELARDVMPAALHAVSDVVQPLGRIVSHYRIEEVIGGGGMGVVYKARDLTLGRPVALKFLSAHLTGDPDARRRLEREARAASTLDHPNIATVYEIGAADPLHGGDAPLFIAMAYYAGETLREKITAGPVPLGDALRYAMEVAAGLTRAHEAGIVHRDIKPANIIVTNRGEVKILDFGLATFVGAERTRDKAFLGTVAYMSPEQTRGEVVDHRTDIWSLGALLYEMLSGRRPFQGSTDAVVIQAIRHDELQPVRRLRPEVPAAVAHAIEKCLAKDCRDRYQRPSDLVAALRVVQTGTDPGAHPARRPGIRRRLAAAIAAGAATVAVIAVAASFLKHGTGPHGRPYVVPLTTLSGSESWPSFSPDGEQIAFSWDGGKTRSANDGNLDIYVKLIGNADVRRVTTDAATDHRAAWSPDGRQIAFVRHSPDGASLRVVSPLGGEDRKLSDFRVLMSSIAWAPDGRWVVAGGSPTGDSNTPGQGGIYLISATGGEPRLLARAESSALLREPAFSPDGQHLAYAACLGPLQTSCEVHVMELGRDYAPGGKPRRLTTSPTRISSLIWSRDGRSLIYADQTAFGLDYLRRVALSGDSSPERIEIAGIGAIAPAIAPHRDRLAFNRLVGGVGIYTTDLTQSPRPLLVSSGAISRDFHPDFSPDGSRIAFSSTRSGDAVEVWIAGADGSKARQLTHGPGSYQGSPAWSPDGRLIAFDARGDDGNWDIWVIDPDGGAPRRVTSDPGDENNPTWSRDGRWIYFSATEPLGRNIFRVPVTGGARVRVTREDNVYTAHESADGRELFYEQRHEFATPLLAVPVDGGTARQVVPCVRGGGYFKVFPNGIYYAACSGPEADLHRLDHATGHDRIVGRVPTTSSVNRFAVSPDQKTFLIHQESFESDLMLIENFR